MVLVVKNPPANAGDTRLRFDSWVRKISWRRHGNPLQYSCLGNPVDRGAWWSTVHGVTKSRTQLKRLSTHTCKALKSNSYYKISKGHFIFLKL